MTSKSGSLTDRRLKKKQEEEYQKRLKNVKGKLDLTPPRNMTYTIQLNRVHAEQERQAAIDKQNLVIIERLSGIKKSPSRVDHVNKDYKPGNDRLKKFRERRQRRIDQENRLIAERLQNVESYYSAEEWEKDYKKHMYYLSMMENSTKDYDKIEDEDDDFDNSDEEDHEDAESLPPVPPATPTQENKHKDKNSDEEDNISLPPIEDKGKRNNQEKDEQDIDEYSEQDAIMDAEELHTAIEENDKDKILEILGRTSEKEKFDELRDKYKEMYKKDLMEDVESKVDDDVKNFLESQSSDTAAASEDAKRLHEAMKGLGTDEDTIIELLCTKNNKELAAIRDDYKKQFDSTLEEDLKGDTSGDVEKLLVQLSKGEREETEKVDEKLAKKDAETLIAAGIGSWGTNEEDFIRVFTMRSLPQLAAMYIEYSKLANTDIAESIDKEMDGDLQKAFLAIVKHSRNPSGAQADKLTKALEEGDTAAVAKIVLPLKQATLSEVSSSYKDANKRKLRDDIDKKCDGDLKAMLLAKLGEKDENKKDKKKGSKDKQGDKLPPLGKKTNQQKKKEEDKKADKKKDQPQKKTDDKKQDKKSDDKKQDKKGSDNSKKDEDTSEKDADEMHQAIQDKDKEKIIDILAKNCTEPKKLKKLQDKYNQDHDEELLDSLKSVVDDEDLQDPIDCLFTPSDEYDAKCLNDAIKGIGTDENLLIQVLCTKTNEELAKIKETYQKKYNSTLESDIKGDTSGDFEDLLVKLLKGSRDDSDKVDKSLAKKEAEALYKAGVQKFGTDEDVFIAILTERNVAQLNATFAEYKKLSKVEIEESIEKEMAGDVQKGLLVLVKTMRNPSDQQSGKLVEGLDSGDTNAVARLILSSDKAKLSEVMSSYKAATGKTLEGEIDKKCSDNLKKLLLAKMGKGKGSQQKKNNQSKSKDVNKDKGKSQSKPAQAKKQGDAAAKGKKDAEGSNLHKAIEAQDKKKITEIIVQNASDKAKLKKLADNYKKDYKKDLLDDLDSQIEKDLYEVVAVMILSAAESDARCLHLAMKGAGTNEGVLIEILCTRSNSEIAEIKDVYEKKYKGSLEDAVKTDTSGDFEDLLVGLLQCKRSESADVNDDQAHKDAETLIEAGIKKWGTDEDSFIKIFTTRSIGHLQAMLDEYAKWAKCELEETITNEMDGDLQTGLLTVVKCLRNPMNAKIDSLHTALQSGDKLTLSRLVAANNEATMKDLETAYNSVHKPKLYFELEKRCSPDVKKILLPKLKDKTQEKTIKKSTKSESKKQSNDQKKAKDHDNDCSKLHTAIQKNDKKTIKEIILRNATEQSKMKKLADDYEKQNKMALVDQLDSKVDEDIHEAVTAMILPAAESDARTLFYAMKGIGTKETQLIEILCTRSNQEIKDLTTIYRKKYGRSLEEDVKGDTNGDFEKLLTDLLTGSRDESTEVDEDKAHNDAAALYEAGVKSWGTDEDKFIEILTTRSTGHLQAMMVEYEKLSGVPLQESIKDEMDGDLRDGLVMLLSCVQDRNKSQADKLHNALQDGDTSTVARIIAGTDQNKMSEIESAYNSTYNTKVYFDVNKKCSEDLKKIILHKLKDKKQEKEKAPAKPGIAKKQSNASQKDKKTKNTAGANKKEGAKKEEEEEESMQLYKAIDKNDKKKVTEIVVRNATEKSKLEKLRDDYKKKYSKDLVEELDSKMEEDLHEAIAAMLLPQSEADARSLYYAMKGIGTHEVLLIEILCTKSNEEMAAMKKEYQTKYGRSLEKDVKSETSGDFENLLIALMKGNRNESSKVDQESAKTDASTLYEAGVKSWGTDEDKFIEILTTRSTGHLQAMMVEYEKLSGVPLQESIKDEMDGDLCDGLVMLLSCVQDRNKSQADKLHNALQDGDTSTVARIIAGTDQDTMSAIEESYNGEHDPKMYFEVEKKCGEDLKKVILGKLTDKSTRKKSPQNRNRSKRASDTGANKDKKNSDDKPSTINDSDRNTNNNDNNDNNNNSNNNSNDTGKSNQPDDKNKSENEQPQDDQAKEDNAKDERAKINIPKVEYRGTISPAEGFDADNEAEKLKKAMKGFGSDEDAIMDVLASCNSAQRQEIIKSYKKQYDKDLIAELKSELSGKFEDTIVALLSPAAIYDATSLNEAMKGLGTNEDVLAEIICSRSNEEIQEIQQTYKDNFGKDLVEAVKDETSGELCDLLIAILQDKRPNGDSIDEDAAYGDAQRLYEAGEKKWGTDESMFVNILTTRSPTQLKAIFQAYKNVSKKDILESIDDELTGDFQKAAKTLVTCIQNPPEHFAESLHDALTGLTTSNTTATRIIITRAEIDLMEIKQTYHAKYGKPLADDVRDCLKGDQEVLLLKILGD